MSSSTDVVRPSDSAVGIALDYVVSCHFRIDERPRQQRTMMMGVTHSQRRFYPVQKSVLLQGSTGRANAACCKPFTSWHARVSLSVAWSGVRAIICDSNCGYGSRCKDTWCKVVLRTKKLVLDRESRAGPGPRILLATTPSSALKLLYCQL